MNNHAVKLEFGPGTKRVHFVRRTGPDFVTIPAEDSPERHVAYSLIIRVEDWHGLPNNKADIFARLDVPDEWALVPKDQQC